MPCASPPVEGADFRWKCTGAAGDRSWNAFAYVDQEADVSARRELEMSIGILGQISRIMRIRQCERQCEAALGEAPYGLRA